MPISRSSAARLCTKPELELVDASAPARIRQLTPGRLRQKVTMARRLRDKYRDLARRQRLEARGKRAPQRARPALGNENTERKAALFDEVLARFEAGLDAAAGSAAGSRAGTKKAGVKKAGAKKTGVKKAGAKKAGAKKTGVKKAGVKKTGVKKTGVKKTGVKKAGAASRRSRGAAPEAQPGERGPAAGRARPAAPAKPGAAALKGARRRPSEEDRQMVGRAKTVHSHTQAATRRRQISRDRRGA